MTIKRTVFLLRSPQEHPYFMLLLAHRDKPLAQLESITAPGTLTEHLYPRLRPMQIERYHKLLKESFGTLDMAEIYKELLPEIEKEHRKIPAQGTSRDGFYLFNAPPFTREHRQAFTALVNGATSPWDGVPKLREVSTRQPPVRAPIKKKKKKKKKTDTPPRPMGRPPRPPEFPVSEEDLLQLQAAQEKWQWNIPVTERQRFDRYVIEWIAAAQKREAPLRRQTQAYVLMSLYHRLQAEALFYVPPLDLFIERLKRGCGGKWFWPPASVWLSTVSGYYNLPTQMNSRMLSMDWDVCVLLHSLDPDGSKAWLTQYPDHAVDFPLDRPWIDAYLYDDTLPPPDYMLDKVRGTRIEADYQDIYQLPTTDPRTDSAL